MSTWNAALWTPMLCAGLLMARPLAAQAPTARSDSMNAMMQQQMAMMGPMFGTMMQSMLEGMLTTMAKPETAERLATFTKNYYDALLRKGFTKDEALRIVISVGLPSMPSRMR